MTNIVYFKKIFGQRLFFVFKLGQMYAKLLLILACHKVIIFYYRESNKHTLILQSSHAS